MKCQHKHHTLTRAYLEDGTPLAIHQCDNCGVAVPEIDPGEVDVWNLPVFDEKLAERGYSRLIKLAFGIVDNGLNVVSKLAKLVKVKTYEQPRNVR